MKRYENSLSDIQLTEYLLNGTLSDLLTVASDLRDKGHGNNVSFSKKVFIPLTKLCRDSCHYCTFAQAPARVHSPYLSREQVLDIARAGRSADCKEALFTLGDKPELRYGVARSALDELGMKSTVDYLYEMSKVVLDETGLFPHINAGVLSREELLRMREVSVSQGIMLESGSERLMQRGMPHFGSPDKDPSVRLRMIEDAGELRIPFTTGLLIGIGETRAERIADLIAIRDLHSRYGHIQEIIVQNFRAKLGTKMAASPEPTFEDLRWTIAAARIILGADINIQAPPNLSKGHLQSLIRAGINDWGGISPVTIDHVNPEMAWPQLTELADLTCSTGKLLIERLAIYPRFALRADDWTNKALRGKVYREIDSEGFRREDAWAPGSTLVPKAFVSMGTLSRDVEKIVARASDGIRLSLPELTRLFAARDADFYYVVESANSLRKETVGDLVRYVVTRNINYTNVCHYGCKFCAFSKGKSHDHLRGQPYDLPISEVVRRAEEAWSRGATEVCLQGGIKPDYTGETYLNLCSAIREALPSIHIHAFSALEITHGAQTLGLSVESYLTRLKEAGLSSLPGTAAEILDDEIRKIISPDKINSQEWLDVIRTAHGVGLRTTATIMFGHVETAESWAKHLLSIRDLQAITRGFTEFVPLPFVHMEAPLFLKGLSRPGPTFREAVLMHAVSRLALHTLIPNIQVSWVKLGPVGSKLCLQAGANDMGGTLMDESISRAAGTLHGQEFAPEQMMSLVRSIGREPVQRTTFYGNAGEERRLASLNAPPLAPKLSFPLRKVSA